jgi:hypothetical protein
MIKHTPLSLITLGLLGIAPLSHASPYENDKTTAKEVRQQVTDAAEAIKNYTVDKRDEAARKAKAALDALDARIHHHVGIAFESRFRTATHSVPLG